MSDWISVKDRLPENFIDVLTYKYGSLKILNYTGSNWENNMETYNGITHWQPLPNPPEPK